MGQLLRATPTAGTVVRGLTRIPDTRDPGVQRSLIPEIPGSTEYMSTQVTDGQWVVDTHDATDPTTQRVYDVMVQLVRDGQDASLRSLQVWSDLARQLDPTRLGSAAGATMVSLAYDLFEKVLAAQREVVDELVATQRHLAQRCFDITATVGDGRARR
ncbi:MAG: hypothetical protein ACRDS0_18850 [Pseudonocardiaceae bacterium]